MGNLHLTNVIVWTAFLGVFLTSTNSQVLFEKPQDFKITERYKMILPVALIFFVVILSTIYNKFSWKEDLLSRFPGPPTVPIFGNILLLAGPPEDILPKFQRLFETYGRRLKFLLCRTPLIVLVDPKDVQTVLSSRELHPSKLLTYGVKWIMGDGLLVSKDEMWKDDRKLLNPAFKYQRIDGFLESFNKHGKILVNDVFKKIINTNGETTSQDLLPSLELCNLDSILESTFGVKSDLQRNSDRTILKCAEIVFESFRERVFKPWLMLPIVNDIFGRGKLERETITVFKNTLHGITVQRNKLEETELKNEKTKPLLDVLMKTRSQQNMFDHMATLIGVGYSTTSTALNFTLYLLALNSEHQIKVQEELDQVLGHDDEMEITFDHLKQLKFLTACIQEALRLFPPVPMIGKSCPSDFQLDKDLVIPKGSEIVVDIYHLHRDPEIYPEPEKFSPARFLSEKNANRSNLPASYLPFSYGTRTCIGQRYAMIQTVVIASYILKKYSLTITVELEGLKLISGLVLEPNKKLLIKLTKRI